MRNYHLDSNILLGRLIGRHEEQTHCNHIIARLQNWARSSDVNIMISQAVLGEILVILRDKSPRDKIGDLFLELMNIIGRLDAKTPSAKKIDYQIALEIMQRDNRLENQPNDALIVAQVLNDPDSEKFFTTDRRILESRYLIEIEENLRNQNKRNRTLRFTDRISRT